MLCRHWSRTDAEGACAISEYIEIGSGSKSAARNLVWAIFVHSDGKDNFEKSTQISLIVWLHIQDFILFWPFDALSNTREAVTLEKFNFKIIHDYLYLCRKWSVKLCSLLWIQPENKSKQMFLEKPMTIGNGRDNPYRYHKVFKQMTRRQVFIQKHRGCYKLFLTNGHRNLNFWDKRVLGKLKHNKTLIIH